MLSECHVHQLEMMIGDGLFCNPHFSAGNTGHRQHQLLLAGVMSRVRC